MFYDVLIQVTASPDIYRENLYIHRGDGFIAVKLKHMLNMNNSRQELSFASGSSLAQAAPNKLRILSN